ncbi:MAG: integrase zinc binding domain-containing protein, partial [Candidatus Phytoplasma australasiaticum]|nr:integrase zinc binding domain-containing protein [Candidatus Phytoplasma australasiaticum]
LKETHCVKYSIHIGMAKMFYDLKQHYWWCGMKRDIAEFVAKCLDCQQFKAEHKKLGGPMQRMLYLSENGSVLLWIL